MRLVAGASSKDAPRDRRRRRHRRPAARASPQTRRSCTSPSSPWTASPTCSPTAPAARPAQRGAARLARRCSCAGTSPSATGRTIATFGDGRWPLEDIPWRTTDGRSPTTTACWSPRWSSRTWSDSRGGRRRPRPGRPGAEELADRGRITRRPLAGRPGACAALPRASRSTLQRQRARSGPALRLVGHRLRRRCCCKRTIGLAVHRAEHASCASELLAARRRGLGPPAASAGIGRLGGRACGTSRRSLHRDRGLATSDPSWYYTERVVECLVSAASWSAATAAAQPAARRARPRPAQRGRAPLRPGAARPAPARGRAAHARRAASDAQATLQPGPRRSSATGPAPPWRSRSTSCASLDELAAARQKRRRRPADMLIFATSDKGGTGRSVTSCNIAYRRALQGNDVCYLDFDFGSPTAGAIFNIERGGPRHPARAACTQYLQGELAAAAADRRVDRVRPAEPARPAAGCRPAGAAARRRGRRRVRHQRRGRRALRRAARCGWRRSSTCAWSTSAPAARTPPRWCWPPPRCRSSRMGVRWLVFHRWTRQHVIAAAGLVYGDRGLLDVGTHARPRPGATCCDRIRFVRTAVRRPGLRRSSRAARRAGGLAARVQRGAAASWPADRASAAPGARHGAARPGAAVAGAAHHRRGRLRTTIANAETVEAFEELAKDVWTTTSAGPGCDAVPRSRFEEVTAERTRAARCRCPTCPSSSATCTWRTSPRAPRAAPSTSPRSRRGSRRRAWPRRRCPGGRPGSAPASWSTTTSAGSAPPPS